MTFSKKNIVIGIVAGLLVPAAIYAGVQQMLSPSAAINCEAGGGCTINVQGGTVNTTGEAPVVAPQTFGSSAGDTTNFTALATTEDMSVGRNLTVAGTAAFTGAATFASTVTSPNLPATVSSTFSASATSTVCAVLNSTGRTVSLLDASIVIPATVSTGTVTFFAGTSTTAYASTTNALISASLNQGWIPVVTPTSTLQTVTSPWNNGEYLVFKSTTTSNVGGGTCRALYY